MINLIIKNSIKYLKREQLQLCSEIMYYRV